MAPEITDWEEIKEDDWEEVPIKADRPQPIEEPRKAPGIFEGFGDQLKEDFLGLPEAALYAGSGFVGSVAGKIAGEVAAPIYSMTGSKDWGKKAKGVRDAVQEVMTYKPMTKTGQEMGEAVATVAGLPFQAVSYPFKKMGEYAEEKGEPNLGYMVEDVGDTLSFAAAPKLAEKYGSIGEKIPEVAKQKFNSAVDYGLNKLGITTKGRGTFQGIDRKSQTGRDMVNTIIENKDIIELTNPETGAKLNKGELPSGKYAMLQLSEAMQQAKRNLWQQIDSMRKESTGKGVVIDTQPIVNYLKGKLEEVPVQRDSALLKHVKDEIVFYEKNKALTPEDLDRIIVDINGKKKDNFNNPERIMLDGEVVKTMRKSLDEAISSTEGEGFQDLKKKYGSILDHEKEINNKAVSTLKRNPKGLGFADIVAVAELARSVGKIATGTTTSGGWLVAPAIEGYKYWRNRKKDPNYIVSRMFKDATKNKGYYGEEYNEWGLPEYVEERPNIVGDAPTRQAPPAPIRPAYGRPLAMPSQEMRRSNIPDMARQPTVLESEIANEPGIGRKTYPVPREEMMPRRQKPPGNTILTKTQESVQVPNRPITAIEARNRSVVKGREQGINERGRLSNVNSFLENQTRGVRGAKQSIKMSEELKKAKAMMEEAQTRANAEPDIMPEKTAYQKPSENVRQAVKEVVEENGWILDEGNWSPDFGFTMRHPETGTSLSFTRLSEIPEKIAEFKRR